ncbi:hypothetical protein RFI_15100, partial [Reticulomyxa filosa]
MQRWKQLSSDLLNYVSENSIKKKLNSNDNETVLQGLRDFIAYTLNTKFTSKLYSDVCMRLSSGDPTIKRYAFLALLAIVRVQPEIGLLFTSSCLHTAVQNHLPGRVRAISVRTYFSFSKDLARLGWEYFVQTCEAFLRVFYFYMCTYMHTYIYMRRVATFVIGKTLTACEDKEEDMYDLLLSSNGLGMLLQVLWNETSLPVFANSVNVIIDAEAVLGKHQICRPVAFARTLLKHLYQYREYGIDDMVSTVPLSKTTTIAMTATTYTDRKALTNMSSRSWLTANQFFISHLLDALCWVDDNVLTLSQIDHLLKIIRPYLYCFHTNVVVASCIQ